MFSTEYLQKDENLYLFLCKTLSVRPLCVCFTMEIVWLGSTYVTYKWISRFMSGSQLVEHLIDKVVAHSSRYQGSWLT